MGPRPHQIHVAPQDVQELGELVQSELPEPAAQPGQPWIVGNLEGRAANVQMLVMIAHLFRVIAHGPEFVKDE